MAAPTALLMVAAIVLPAILDTAKGVLAAEPETVALWPNGAPDAKGTSDNDKPTLTIYPAPEDKAAGTGVVVCPGGGYVHLSMEKEGSDVAKWLNSLGISAFVLKYRLGGDGYQHPAPMEDGQRAIRLVRANAEKWRVDPNRIGMMGFSAGGHLTSTVGTHFDSGHPDDPDSVEHASCRPDFLVLVYPVISMTMTQTHSGSKKALLGTNPDPELVKSLSNELQVTAETPPTFLVATNADTSVPAENSVEFYLALRKAKVPAELHIWEEGKHGFGLAPSDPVLSAWKDRLADWFKTRKLLTPESAH
ncbi:MAG TPA: alpha/beta hydrolase [Pirellulales bacterium]|jgi:acetyl esterase/lipase